MTYSGMEPRQDRRWVTVILVTWLSALAVGFGVAYLVWTAFAPVGPDGRIVDRAPSSVLESATRQ
jgi:hypothetical protein